MAPLNCKICKNLDGKLAIGHHHFGPAVSLQKILSLVVKKSYEPCPLYMQIPRHLMTIWQHTWLCFTHIVLSTNQKLRDYHSFGLYVTSMVTGKKATLPEMANLFDDLNVYSDMLNKEWFSSKT